VTESLISAKTPHRMTSNKGAIIWKGCSRHPVAAQIVELSDPFWKCGYKYQPPVLGPCENGCYIKQSSSTGHIHMHTSFVFGGVHHEQRHVPCSYEADTYR
jgi:hypothetical protein